jgi:hypothetical protein
MGVCGQIWNVLIKIHGFLERLFVFLQTVLQDGRFNRQDSVRLFVHFTFDDICLLNTV